jgi:hypothetical protein
VRYIFCSLSFYLHIFQQVWPLDFPSKLRCVAASIFEFIRSSIWISIYPTTRFLTSLIGRYSFKPLLLLLSACRHSCLDCVWNVMAHAQKPDCVFRRNGRVHLNRPGASFSRLLAAEVCASAVVMLDTPCSELVWSVLATHSICQFSLHFLSRASPCAITFQLDSTIFCLILSLPSPTRHGSLFVLFRGMPFDTFGLRRACGWRMNEYQGNIVLVCVGCGVGGRSVLRHLFYSFLNLDMREWTKNKMLILAEICCWINRK